MVPGYGAGLTGDCSKKAGNHFIKDWDIKCATEDKVIEKEG